MKLGKGQKLVIAAGVLIGGRKFLFASQQKIEVLKNVKASDLKNLRPDFGRLSTEMIVIGIATAVGVVVLGAFATMAKTR
jgi:hypothetical protein